ncbi:MAG: C69 family dipeptidase, partial [Bacteroidales bacterium]|nr:C69 family dipeptidase [Bacteroidales bacterium]
MKKVFISIVLLISLFSVEALACTNLIVGKKASIDGSIICTYNCDSYGMAGSLKHSPAGFHQPGEMIVLRGLGPNGEPRAIPQVSYTYNVNGLMNEKQLCIMETTFGGRPELQNREGWLGYYQMMDLALQRCATAREAIQCMADLVAEYGYSSTGETLTVCDK